jgi:hypothetical protein
MKLITKNVYLQGLGLFSLAQSYAQKAKETELALIELLECQEDGMPGYGGHISDGIYDHDEKFDTVLKRAEYAVRKSK